MNRFKTTLAKGFTLVELLIVMAILGIIAGAVIVALDPAEQINRGRDAGLKTTVSQLGSAVQSYYTIQAAMPATSNGWMTTLVNAGELKAVPPAPATAMTDAQCPAANRHNNFCYRISGTEAVVYAKTASKTEAQRANGCAVANTYIVFSTRDGNKTGTWCSTLAGGVGPDATASLTLY